MHKALLGALLGSLLMTVAVGQDIKKSCTWENKYHISSDKPTIYITFEKEGLANIVEVFDVDGESVESRKYVWARLHNNTAQGIYVYAMNALVLYAVNMPNQQELCFRESVVAKEDQEVEVIYYAELRTDAKNNTPYLNWHSTTAGPIWIAPGASMLFKMPYDDLGPDWDIKIPYHYEWEDNVGKNDSSDNLSILGEPRHFVYFQFYRLPESVKKEILK